MILLLDNYDSFTYNLAQYLGELGCEVEVHRNDKISVEEIARKKPERIVISPGPCTPREAGISVELIEELFRAAARKFTCPECGTTGLIVRAAAREDDEDWGMARACDECGRPIARERLEIFPDTRLCVACEGSEDRGELTGPAEYCPRCGNLMTVRPTRTAGITRYKLACSKCRG